MNIITKKRLLFYVVIIYIILVNTLVPLSIAMPEAADELIITTQDNSLHNSIINPIIFSGYGYLYSDKYGRIWARSSTSRELWMYNGTWNKLIGFNRSIYSVYYTDNDVLLVSLLGELKRSTDNGSTFSTVLTFSNTTYQAPWSYGSYGNKVVVGQYGPRSVIGESRSVWLSEDNGVAWNIIYSTNNTHAGSHIHKVGIDKNGVIYVTHGDSYKDTLRSIDNGYTWDHFGITDQFTSMAFSDNSILLGNDPVAQFIETNDTSSKILTNLPYPWTNYIGKMDYINGVFYAIQGEEYKYPIKTGLWISTNGRDWYLIYDITGIGGVFSGLAHDKNNFTWGALANYSYIWQNRLLTIEEARELIYGNLQNRTIAIDPHYYSFYANPLINAHITIYGQTVRNLVTNPSFENDLSYWGRTIDTTLDNLTIDNKEYHSGDRSLYLKTNGYGYRGKIYQPVFNDNVTPLPAGTIVTWSAWIKLNSSEENAGPTPNYNPSIILGTWVKYQDGTWLDSQNIKAMVNTGGKWVRISKTQTFSKPVQRMDSTIFFEQKFDAWVDDLQVQIGKLSPYINGTANTSGTLDVDGELITIHDLGNGNSMTVDLARDFNNFVTITPNLGGSKVAIVNLFGEPINPLSIISSSQTFNITINKNADVIWYLDGSVIKTDIGVSTSSYSSTADIGEHIVNATVKNGNDTKSKVWTWNVIQ